MTAETQDGAALHPNAGSENSLPIGTRLSDFEITDVLGEGGFGIVYLAYDHALQRTVAIKEYMPGALVMRTDGGRVALRAERHKDTFRLGLKSFINEARLLARFDHPALVKVYRFWEQNNTAYTAMKYYDGLTIKDIVKTRPELVDEAWCRKVTGQILQALEMLYTMQILHRDISPDNIIVQDNGDAVLLDFGSARQIIGDVTRGLTVILKPGYAPVEQYAGDASLAQGPFTDLYALSAVMYFAITKAPPPSSIGRMINDPIVPLATQAPAGYGAALLAAIDKGLAVLAKDRPQTIAEFRELAGIAATEPPPAPPPTRSPPPMTAPASESAPETAAETVKTMPGWAATAPAKPRDAAAAPAPKRRRLLVGAGLGAAGLVAIAVAGVVLFKRAPAPVPAPPPAPAVAAAPAAEPASAPPALNATVIANVLDNPDTATPPPDATPAAEPPKPEAKPAPAPAGVDYKLKIKPWGTVTVDGKARGVSPPLKHVTLAHGKHEIRIANPSFPEYVTTIDVDNDKPGAIEHDFKDTK